jgi:hypothetical protein
MEEGKEVLENAVTSISKSILMKGGVGIEKSGKDPLSGGESL